MIDGYIHTYEIKVIIATPQCMLLSLHIYIVSTGLATVNIILQHEYIWHASELYYHLPPPPPPPNELPPPKLRLEPDIPALVALISILL